MRQISLKKFANCAWLIPLWLTSVCLSTPFQESLCERARDAFQFSLSSTVPKHAWNFSIIIDVISIPLTFLDFNFPLLALFFCCDRSLALESKRFLMGTIEQKFRVWVEKFPVICLKNDSGLLLNYSADEINQHDALAKRAAVATHTHMLTCYSARCCCCYCCLIYIQFVESVKRKWN